MKLDCHIIGVEDCGDTLKINLQGKSPRDAGWRGMEPQSIKVAHTNAAARSFHVGRRVTITIEPK